MSRRCQWCKIWSVALQGISGMCGACVERMGKGVFDIRCVVMGSDTRLMMRGGLAREGKRGVGCSMWSFGLRRGAGIVRAPLAWRCGVAIHAYALIAGFQGAVPMILPRECLSKRYAAFDVKRMLPCVCAMDRTDRRLVVMSGKTTAETLSVCPLFVLIAVRPA